MKLIITERAAYQLTQLIRQENSSQDLRLRISVSGGGCAGFQYGFTLDDAVNSDDEIFMQHGASVIVDSVSLELIEGSQIDFVEDLVKSSFVIQNPQASGSCGCGHSFSL